MKEMCKSCPHRRENEVGDSILVVKDSKGRLVMSPHPCHDNLKKDCEGHRRTIQKLRLGVIQIEDFQQVSTVCGYFNKVGDK